MNTTKKILQGIITIFVLLSTLFPINASFAQGSTDLFTSADGSSADAAYKKPVQVMRLRYVNVNLNLLLDAKGKALDVAATPELTLNLFDDTSFIGVVTKIEKTPNVSTSWIGTLKNVENGYFYIVSTGDAVIVHVASPLGTYEASMVGKNVYRVVQLDQTKFGEDAPIRMPEPGPVLTKADLGPNADTGATIDIMVAYTSTARAAEGSTAAMKARIALAVTETNTGYANAGVTPRLRLVHVEEVAYAETGDIFTDVTRLTATADGFIDQIHTLRNTYAADMVGLIVENGGGYCGVAKTIMATAATAFQVTARDCATGYYSFGHEFGHLQGARHDKYVDTNNTPYAYGHGYTHPSATPSLSWRTIMAYNNACTAVGYNCTRLQYWSNPTKTYSGAAMGVAGSNENYKVLNNTAVTVANFRTAIIGSNFSSSFNTTSTGWAPVWGAWSLSSSAYYITPGALDLWSSAKYANTYGDLTYQVRMYRSGGTNLANTIYFRGNPNTLAVDKVWNSTYWFSYTNGGSFSVYKNVGGTRTALKPWTLSAAIVPSNWNTLKVVAVGSILKFYINNTLVWSTSDTSLKTGKVGFGYYRNATASTLYIDSASLSTTPTADSQMDEVVAPGTELSGGTPYESPLP